MIVCRLMMMPISGSEDTLDLAPNGMGYAASITRRRRDGSSVWTVLPPEGSQQDSWVAVRLEGPQVVANSWPCFLVHLDLETGGEIVRTYTKSSKRNIPAPAGGAAGWNRPRRTPKPT